MAVDFLAAERFMYYDGDTDPLSVATRCIVNYVCRDRFGLINDLGPYNLSNKADQLPQHTEETNVADLFDKRACDLIAKYDRIAFAWSGGVDSHSVITAILRNMPAPEYSRRLHVYGTPSSVEEAPAYQAFLQKLGVPVTIADNVFEPLGTAPCDVILNGCGVGNLFGHHTLEESPRIYNGLLEDTFKDAWALKNPKSTVTRRQVSQVAYTFKKYAEALGVECKTFGDFEKLFAFGLRCTMGRDQLTMWMAKYPNAEKNLSFTRDQMFDNWFISTFAEHESRSVYQNPMNYKRALKDYIFSFDKDEVYYNTKGKVDSIKGVSYPFDKQIAVLTTDGLVCYENTEDGGHRQFMDKLCTQYRRGDSDELYTLCCG